MEESERHYWQAIWETRLLRAPRQSLATFGTTVIRYYLLAKPVYSELQIPNLSEETVVREGVVRSERPRVVTPFYLMRHEGFSNEATGYLEEMIQLNRGDQPGILYSYSNEPKETSIVSGPVTEVARRISERLDKEGRNLEAVIQGVDAMWDVSVMKFIYELTKSSVESNANELNNRGLLDMKGNTPREALQRIERLLEGARHGTVDPAEVHRELVRWDVFDEYQDRFLELFGRR